MKALKSSNNLMILLIFGGVAIAVLFWVALLGPKRDEASRLGEEVEQVEASLVQHRTEISEGEEARRQFPADYEKLVVLGKAVPSSDETASLLVQITHLAKKVGVEFQIIELSSEGGGESTEASTATTSGQPVSPTETAASLASLGASVGPAGLSVMPYELTFDGSWFQMADFIKGLDSLVKTQNNKVAVDGRLITINGFGLEAGPNGFPALQATVLVTTYLTPPGQGVTAGATTESSEGVTAPTAESTTP